MMRRVNILCSFALLFASQNSLAVTYPLPPEGSRLVGQSLTVTVPDHNTQPLETFAAQYGQGLSNMLEANPGAQTAGCFFAEAWLTTHHSAATDFARHCS
ncbi:hypothetical protein EIMP300_43700 [Escherichia coli]|uniref:ErfK/YbiS/YcfS/YnhG family protein n=1 Tax=Escherichia coli TaxID=562 RepID=A0A8S0FSV8_ECOLX|nr:hypothetical protein EIMP300_43700 [Escherichia coli]